MIAKTDSTHAKLYKFTYTSDLPKNLCPYFWKLVGAVIVFIPNFILQLPFLIVGLFDKDTNEHCNERRLFGGFIELAIAVAIGYIYITVQWIKWMFDCYSYSKDGATGGGMVNLFITVIFIIFLVKELISNWKDRRHVARGNDPVERTPNLIAEFIKAKYNRYCPQIEWKETTKTT